MTNEEPIMDDEQAGEAVARYLEDNPELLQGIVPEHDLWPAIESRISARVVSISAAPVRVARRSPGWMPMLIAASALIAGSAGITYVLTTHSTAAGVAAGSAAATTAATPSSPLNDSGALPATQTVQPQAGTTAVAHNDAPADGAEDAPVITHQRRSSVRLASRPGPTGGDAIRKTYDSEIRTLHAAVEARRGQLNESTIAVIEQNLRVIDEAIRQSKEALAKDPNSRLLNDQLDRTLAKKTGLLRAAALLPAA
jgi:hypothetical protein